MSRSFVLAFLTTNIFCYAVAKSNEFATSELVKKQPNEDKLLASIVRARNSSHLKGSGNAEEEYDNDSDKQLRTADHRLKSESRDKSNILIIHCASKSLHHGKLKRVSSSCCGSRYGSNSSGRPDLYYDRISGDTDRYPTKFGERLSVDRYGWQTQGQPPGWGGSSRRPAGGSFSGTAFHEGSEAGDRFSSRPSYGSEGSRKPTAFQAGVSGGYGHGNEGHGGYGFVRPSTGYIGLTGNGAYGISGTLADGDEFGLAGSNYPEGNAPSHPNVQAQKAVALKALAGVALIGAAAALATNPVLLPLGVVSGRRKRSNVSIRDKQAYMNYILTVLKRDAAKNYSDGDGNKTTLSPACVARLACEIQQNYRPDTSVFQQKSELERRLNNLISNNVPKEEFARMRIGQLIRAASIVASNGENCNSFTCTFVKTMETKNQSVLKV